MVIKIERRANEKYPSTAALVKALNDATFAAKRALPIVGGQVYDATCITQLIIICENGCEWEPGNLSQKPYGIFIW
jgi:hypothetical protein